MSETTWSESLAQADWAEERAPLSVSHAFEQLTDGRHARGGRSSVALGLTLLGLGKGPGMPPSPRWLSGCAGAQRGGARGCPAQGSRSPA